MSIMSIRPGLVREVVVMALDTLRVNKMRSGLTVLGVVIGITSIVGMTAMIRGFDESLRQAIREIGPNLIFVQRFGLLSFTSGATFNDLIRRPNLSVSDARAMSGSSVSTTSTSAHTWCRLSQRLKFQRPTSARRLWNACCKSYRTRTRPSGVSSFLPNS